MDFFTKPFRKRNQSPDAIRYISPPASARRESSEEEEEADFEGIRHPRYVTGLSLVRRSPENVDPKAKPAVRIVLRAHTPFEDSFAFKPIEFTLVSDGLAKRFCRYKVGPGKDSTVDGDDRKIAFKSKTLTRGCHAQIWCENKMVFIQDTGSSAGTFLNDERLVEEPSSVSPPYKVKDGDVIQLGRNYTGGDAGPKDPSVFKCVQAKVFIEQLDDSAGPSQAGYNVKTEQEVQPVPVTVPTPLQESTPELEPESEPEPVGERMEITFNCLPYCDCPWRMLFHEKGIYSIDLGVQSPKTISSAIESWLLRQPSVNEKWGDWEEQDAVVLMTVIEKIIRMKSSPADVVLCQSWIRKIARHTGALPETFVLKGAKRKSLHPVSGGGFADIYIGTHAGKEVALKVLRVFMTKENRRKVFREVVHEALFWKHLNHPHILPFLGISADALVPHLSLVSPWMPNGNVLSYIETHGDKVDRMPLIAQCSHGLRYLHEHNPGLIHGDIKGANILIDGDGTARITDFGLISITETQAFGTSFTVHTERGSVRWMAQELFGSEMRKNRSTDAYAFGMTVLEIYTNQPPFSNYTNDMQLVMALSRGERPGRPPENVKMYEDLWKLINRCWDLDPECRPSMREVADNLDSLLALRARGLLSFNSNPSSPAARPNLNPFRNRQSNVAPRAASAMSFDTQDTVFSSTWSGNGSRTASPEHTHSGINGF